nr:MAG TPA: hypothetical protein [Caudoviricetes sp.]
MFAHVRLKYVTNKMQEQTDAYLLMFEKAADPLGGG